MLVTCTKNELLSKINVVSKAVAVKTTMPILECILITADSAGMRLTANNLELAIQTSNMTDDVTIMEKGLAAPEAKVFFEIIRNLPDNIVTLETDENNTLIIKSGKSEFKILSLPGNDFPEITHVEKIIKYDVKSNIFKSMIKQTIFSVAVEDSKPVLTGELIEIKEDCFNIVAIDGFRVSFRKNIIDNKNENVSVVVPAKTLNEISRIISDKEDEMISMYFTDNHALFETEDFTVVSRLLEGEFFKYEQSFINEYTTLVRIDRHELLSSVERATLISRDSKKNPVEFKIVDNKMIITSNTETGTSYEEVYADTEGEDLTIGFNPRYIIDALKAVEDEKINIKFMSSLSPCVIEEIDGESYKYLILPLRIKG